MWESCEASQSVLNTAGGTRRSKHLFNIQLQNRQEISKYVEQKLTVGILKFVDCWSVASERGLLTYKNLSICPFVLWYKTVAVLRHSHHFVPENGATNI